MGELVSVVICAYNHEKFVADAIESVFSQDYRPLQLIISDDGSKDGTRAAIERKLREAPEGVQVVCCHVDENTGLAASLNRMCTRVEGRVAVMLAGDDFAESCRVRRTLEIFQARPDVKMVWSDYSIIDENGKILRTSSGLPALPGLYTPDDYLDDKTPPFLGATCAYVSEVFRKFDPLLEGVMQEDVIFPFRCFSLGPGVFVADTLVRYRTHAGNIHFGGFHQSSRELVIRIIRLRSSRLAVARQKIIDAKRLVDLGFPPAPAVIKRLERELSVASFEKTVAETPSAFGRVTAIAWRAILRRLPWKDAVRLFLLYVTPSAYLTALNVRIWLSRRGRKVEPSPAS
jgi:glycosyltransferase involved in cell wall biosynthesis